MKKVLLIILSAIGLFIFFSIAVAMCSDPVTKPDIDISKDSSKDKDSLNYALQKEQDSMNNELIKKLKPLFNEKTDKYDANKKIWITPKNAPVYNNQKGNYLYFEMKNERANNLRFKFQYYSDDWLFIENLVFLIDDEPIKYTPKSSVERDHDGGKIWEWFDDSVSKSDLVLFEKISNAQEVEIKINGSKYYDERKLTKKDIETFKNTLEYFKALNGRVF